LRRPAFSCYLIEKETDAHQAVVGGIGPKALERKPLIGKLLEDAEGQLAPAAVMVACDDPFRREYGPETIPRLV
jgi:hypothetical protein